MAGADERVVEHYTKPGLFERIMAALGAEGISADAVTAGDLEPVDEFHIGGVEATDELLDQLEIDADTEVLEIGSGIGGPARHIAARHGARVTGLDLTPEFVETARRLTKAVGLAVEFQVGSALDMPFDDDRFDLATLIHVGMNLPDKPRLFAEAARVLRPGGVLAVYDVMRTGADHPAFPVPWAARPEASFLDLPQTYLDAAAAAGFTLTARRDRGAFAREFFANLSASMSGAAAASPLGLGLVMGAEAPVMVANMKAAVGAGHIAPVEMIFRAP